LSAISSNSVIIVGAGIVGLAIAQRLLGEGVAVTVVDRDPAGDKTSFGNAGGIAVTEVVPASVPGLAWRVPGWLLDPLGPLAVRPAHAVRLMPWLWRFAQAGRPSEVARIAAALAALNNRVYDDLLPLLATTGLSDELHRNGALTVYESEAGFHRDAAEWALKRAHGIVVEELTAEQARALEPALGPIVKRGVFTPQWSDVNDPKRLTDRLRVWLQANGVAIVAGHVTSLTAGVQARVTLEGGREIRADQVVVAAGAWSGRLAKGIGDPVSIESERGYNTTLPEPGLTLSREVIFAERKFVATTLTCGLRIGGAAEFGGLEAVANFKRSRALVELARSYLPGLKSEGGTEWAGHRPTTPDSLPVIGRSPRQPRIVYAFGHGHLGLTQAATTGRLVADLVCGKPPVIDLAPYAITRFS
jgi:D-amino-acid dehydrogenase